MLKKMRKEKKKKNEKKEKEIPVEILLAVTAAASLRN